MKHLGSVGGWILVAAVISACEAPRISPQSTIPTETNPTIEVPPPTAQQLNFPQMTGTAQALPTFPFIIEPTQTPAMPGVNDPMIVSPDGKFAVACKETFWILLNMHAYEIISTYATYMYDCEQQIHWAPDSSYATFTVGYDGIMRWRTDGSQPELFKINIFQDPNYFSCNGKLLWSPDEQFLAIDECGIYIIRPFEESTFQNPLLVEKTYYEDFRWATSRLLMLDHHRTYIFYNVLENGTGESVGWWDKDGLGCLAQPPFISPDEHWIVFDVSQYQCGISSENSIYQYSVVDLETGTTQILSNRFGNLIDFIGWSPDSRGFYIISRPINSNITADPRTPFGLLVLDTETLQIKNLFEQAWYISFNKEMSWAHVVFPATNDDGSLRFDGALWRVGSTELIGRQTMFYGMPDDNLYPGNWTSYMYSVTGAELAYSSQTRSHPQVAFWSHDNARVAIINSDHQLVVISVAGDVQVIGTLDVSNNWFYPVITWSDDNKVLDLEGVKWDVPEIL